LRRAAVLLARWMAWSWVLLAPKVRVEAVLLLLLGADALATARLGAGTVAAATMAAFWAGSTSLPFLLPLALAESTEAAVTGTGGGIRVDPCCLAAACRRALHRRPVGR
jgi:hypothetical protein